MPKTIDGYDLVNSKLISESFSKDFSDNFEFQENGLYVGTGDSVKDSLIEYIQNTKIPRNNRLKDRISMAFGIELRLPFLEHDLLEYALSLDTKSYF